MNFKFANGKGRAAGEEYIEEVSLKCGEIMKFDSEVTVWGKESRHDVYCIEKTSN